MSVGRGGGSAMRARVVYESMFGNTQAIAQAVADGLAESMSVDLEEIGSAATDVAADVGLLVVGGPTHAFGMSRSEPANPLLYRLQETLYRRAMDYASGSVP